MATRAKEFANLKAKQWAEATNIGKFPYMSWLLAGVCLCGLGISEILFVRPARQRLERTEAEQSAVDLGQAPKVLASGKVLMPDGRIVQGSVPGAIDGHRPEGGYRVPSTRDLLDTISGKRH